MTSNKKKKYTFLHYFMVNAKINHNSDLHTANVCRDLRGVYREIRVRGFQIYGDCMLPTIPVILKSPYSDFHCGDDKFRNSTAKRSHLNICNDKR